MESMNFMFKALWRNFKPVLHVCLEKFVSTSFLDTCKDCRKTHNDSSSNNT